MATAKNSMKRRPHKFEEEAALRGVARVDRKTAGRDGAASNLSTTKKVLKLAG